jgi:intracellular septation protein
MDAPREHEAQGQSAPPTDRAGDTAGTKLLLDLGPIAAFVVAYVIGGFNAATAVLMAATVASLVLSRMLLGKIAVMPIVTAILVVVFGSLTLYLNDPTFFKMKPTIAYLIFASGLAIGLVLGKPALKILLGEAFQLTDVGWRILTMRWAIFFLALAGLNEIVWRNFSESAWVAFKVGTIPLSIVFFFLQMPLLKRHGATTPQP